MLAEDNPVEPAAGCRIMEKAGHVVVLAPNGREALYAYEKTGLRRDLMAIQRPELDGSG